ERFAIIAGERRYAAARELGLLAVPVVIRSLDAHRRLEVQLIENLQRKDLDPFEEADSYARLIGEFGVSQDALGKRLGKSRTSINEALSIARLSAGVREEYRRTSGTISRSLLVELAKEMNAANQERLWALAKEGKLTVKQARLRRARPVRATGAGSACRPL